MKPYETLDDLAAAIREARGSMTQEKLGEWIGRDKKTIMRMEAGEEGTLGKNVNQRRATAIVIAAATGKPELLGLSAPEPTEVDQLRKEFEGELKAAKTELRTERAEEIGALEARLLKLEHAAQTTKETG